MRCTCGDMMANSWPRQHARGGGQLTCLHCHRADAVDSQAPAERGQAGLHGGPSSSTEGDLRAGNGDGPAVVDGSAAGHARTQHGHVRSPVQHDATTVALRDPEGTRPHTRGARCKVGTREPHRERTVGSCWEGGSRTASACELVAVMDASNTVLLVATLSPPPKSARQASRCTSLSTAPWDVPMCLPAHAVATQHQRRVRHGA